MDAARIVADFMTAFPNGASQTQAQIWLSYRGIEQGIINALLPVLEQMWLAALEAGVKAANEQPAVRQDFSQQEYQDLLAQLKRQWVRQIATTTISQMAGALAQGARTAAALTAALLAVLANLDRAKKIAVTEVTRAMALVAQLLYHRAGHRYVRWITENDNRVCPSCQMNQDAGDWPLGVPFPSGAPYPPDHPGCRCAVVPAKDNYDL